MRPESDKKKYESWSKDELIRELIRIKSTTYGLVWHRDLPEEKIDLLVNPDARTPNELFSNEVVGKPFPVVKEVKSREICTDDKLPVNLLIEGDNYHSLAVLNFTHQEAVDLIYIDPPYNTGHGDFIYNDRFVDKEDPFRHSKWLSFMEKRLKLSKNLLKDTGVMFISIDDNEQAALKLLCDEIFGERNVEVMIWHKVDDDSGRLKITHRFRREHEYILTCYKNKDSVFFNKYLSDRNYKNEYTNPDNDPRGPYKQGIISSTEEKSNPNGKNFYDVVTPSGKVFSRQWRFPKEQFDLLHKDGRIYYGKKGSSVPSLKVFIGEQKETTPTSILSGMGTAKTAGLDLENIFGDKPFNYPKPVALIQHLIEIATTKNSIVLDFFAGSGTTGQAVLEQNSKDDGMRQFILCTNNGDEKSEHKIASEVCYPRIKKVIHGYKNSKNENIAGLKGNLRYYMCDFVEAEPTDRNKRKLVKESTEMLCIRESAYEMIKENEDYKIFKNTNGYVGIIFYEDAIEDYKNAIKKIEGHFNTYVFSLGDDTHERQFIDVKDKVSLRAIPEFILKVYREIFK